MAPRKKSNNNNTTQQIPKKSRSKIVKPNAKSPNNIKIEVSVEKSSESPRRVTRKRSNEKKIAIANDESPASVTKKQATIYDEQKIELANEVVRYQLNKNPQTLIFKKKIPTVEVTNNKKRKVIVPKYLQEQSGLDGKGNETPKKKVTQKTTLDSNVSTKKAVTRKRSADSTQKNEKCTKVEETNVKPKRRRINKNSNVVQKVPQKEDIIEGKDNVTEEFKNKPSSVLTMINVQTIGIRHPVSNCAGRVDSRKTSSTSSMSWTKDLSSSGKTSINASRSDFVRIDRKLPVLKLTNVNSGIKNKQGIKDKDISSIDSDSSDSTHSEKSIDTFEIKSLNLSTSSLSNSPNSNVNTIQYKLNKAFNKLTSKLKHFDLEIMTWIGYGNEKTDVSMKSFQDKIIAVLKEECEVITHCQHLKRILSKDGEFKFSETEFVEVNLEKHIAEVDAISRNIPEYGSNNKNNSVHQVVHNELAETDCNDNEHVKSKNNENYDDDDAISIYAESITGIESERLSNSFTAVSKECSEYIPLPLKKDESVPIKYTYCPTKISGENQLIVKKTVCEKQTADSTSKFKDNFCEQVSEVDVSSNSSVVTVNNLNNGSTEIAKLPQASIPLNMEPILMNNIHKAKGEFSSVFQNLCKFNLLNRCKKSPCRYLHVVPDVLEVRNKLHSLTDEAFLSEYVAVRNVYGVCRKYGICFVEECCNRDMLRLSVDMAKDFFMNAKIISKSDSIFIRDILECVLLKLNIVDLNICEDLLMHSVTPTMRLCDVFMQTIAETQNFSRFKIVFLNLTHFIVKHGGIFNLLVAEHILERVCILPPEKPLCRALIDIMKNTDAAILKNKMIGKFENMLLMLDKKLHDDLLSIKMEVIGSLLTSPSDSNASSQLSNNMEAMPVNTIVNVGDKSYSSPDTTDVNSLKNRLSVDVKFTRTMNFNEPCFKKPNNITNLSNDNVDNKRKTENFKKWGQKSPQMFPPPLLGLAITRPNLAPNNGNNRHVAYRPAVTRTQWRR